MTPLVVGLSGPAPTAAERAMLAAVEPAGIILFARNIVDPVQLRALTDDLRMATGRDDLPILIDQEGGADARLGPPHWPATPAAAVFGATWARAPMTAIQAARAQGEVLGRMLAAAGITMNAAPVLDLTCPGAHPAIASRTFSDDPLAVAALGRACVEGMAQAGVVAIVKHLPGHGRAAIDPHAALPVVDAPVDALEADLAPFRRLSGQPAAMVGHVVYRAWDDERPASLSPTVIGEVIRGAIGFDGLLLSDDIHMKALAGPIERRAADALAAGCDLALCCHAGPAEVARIAGDVGRIGPAAADRLTRARAPSPRLGDLREAIVRRDALLLAGEGADRLALPAGSA